MDIPIFKLDPADRAMIWAILNKYPQYLDKKFELKLKIGPITIHPSVRVRGLITDIIGEQ